MHQVQQAVVHRPVSECIRDVSIDQPFTWLGKGWADLVRAPRLSIVHGMIFTISGFILFVGLSWMEMGYLIFPMSAGFILVGPVLAIGLYDISRRFSRGSQPRPGRCFRASRHNLYHIMTAGVVLMIFAIIWSRLAVLTFVLSFPYIGLNFDRFINELLFTMEGAIFLVVGTTIGAILAAVAFVFSVVTLPMMLDRKVDVFTASLVSFLVVRKNKAAMLTWAMLIVIFISVGLFTGYFGLAITLPLIAYASWHAYEACVDSSRWVQNPMD